MVRRFDVQRSQTRVALTLFASSQRLVFRFGKSYSRAQVYRELKKLSLLRGRRRNTARALMYVKRHMFRGKPTCGRRRVLVLVTARETRDNVVRPARILHAAGIEVYTVGLGRVSVRYLRKIATDRFHAFVKNARSLLTIVRTIKDRMCHSPSKTT